MYKRASVPGKQSMQLRIPFLDICLPWVCPLGVSRQILVEHQPAEKNELTRFTEKKKGGSGQKKMAGGEDRGEWQHSFFR